MNGSTYTHLPHPTTTAQKSTYPPGIFRGVVSCRDVRFLGCKHLLTTCSENQTFSEVVSIIVTWRVNGFFVQWKDKLR